MFSGFDFSLHLYIFSDSLMFFLNLMYYYSLYVCAYALLHFGVIKNDTISLISVLLRAT